MISAPVKGANKRRSRPAPQPKRFKVAGQKIRLAQIIKPGSFEEADHFYPRVLNATIHPMVETFLNLGNERLLKRFLHFYPKANESILEKVLQTPTKYFRWGGSDLFSVTSHAGQKSMIVIETNSCPSGQKSMPGGTQGVAKGYQELMGKTFMPMIEENKDSLPEGGLAVIYDKNHMEASGYAAALADAANEPVWFAEFYKDDPDPPVCFKHKVLYIRDEQGEWHPMRACFRYLTQKPWNRLPVDSKTLVFNNIICCLAGGRNKMAADKAYEFYNRELQQNDAGVEIRVPHTIRDVCKEEVPLWVNSMGGKAVVKVPYSNAGQGVYTIFSQQDLDKFMNSTEVYEKYIVQSLVGNSTWSSTTRKGQYYHTGTIPNKKKEIFVTDLRMMVRADQDGFHPVAIYARRARKPLVTNISPEDDSWAILGTNLSVLMPDGTFTTESNRLRLMDMKDFNALGLGLDDLIDAYMQTVLSVVAIDNMAKQLTSKGYFDKALYSSVNLDEALHREILSMNDNKTAEERAAAKAAVGEPKILVKTAAIKLPTS